MAGDRVLIGMSGGVDSSVSAVILKRMGYEPVGCTLKLHPYIDKDAADAKAVCEKIGMEFHFLDFRADFNSTVVADFINVYEQGGTPNPCVVCNRHIKFAKMIEAADKLGCKYVATGHYAEIKQENGRYVIYRPDDLSKDQTYVLYNLTQQQLSRVIFPLYNIKKDEVRKIADELGLVSAHKKDSQDICFIPDGDYAAFIENATGKKCEKGNFIDSEGKILGQHNGIIHYTVGQRKGLGIALGKPAFVISKDVESRNVTLGTDENALFYKKVKINRTNFLPFDKLTEPLTVEAKLRYRHPAQPAVIYPADSGDEVIIEFNEPQRAPSPGQSAVFYKNGALVGGGIIIGGIE